MTPDAGHAFYRARFAPRRSLTPGQARAIIVGAGVVSAALSVPFFVLGAWPVVGFFGLDVAGLALAFAASFRAARAYEDVEISPLELVFAKVSARGARREWRFNPRWVRLVRRDHAAYGLTRLAFGFRDREVEVAGFLGPDERERAAADLSRALAQARRGPDFS